MLWHTKTSEQESHPMLSPVKHNILGKGKKQKKKYSIQCLLYILFFQSTCKTTLLDRTNTAAMRYMQPMILFLSKTTSSVGGAIILASFDETALCIKLIVRAPTTHINVPTIFTLPYRQLRATFSSLHPHCKIHHWFSLLIDRTSTL